MFLFGLPIDQGRQLQNRTTVPATTSTPIRPVSGGPDVAGVDHRRSAVDDQLTANTLKAGEVFHKISGGRNALGGFGHPSGDLAGSGDVLRSQDGPEVRDQ